MGKFQDLTGQRFGKWLVLRVSHIRSRVADQPTKWLCRCDCGAEVEVYATSLTRGMSTSCGCKMVERSRTHGLSAHPLYDIWAGIRSRILNESDDVYDRYGGRGLAMEPEWQDSPTEFIRWVEDNLGERPSPSHSIDRMENDKGYLKSNIRWATSTQQGRNKRNNHLLTIGDDTRTLSEWSVLTGVQASTIRARLKARWPTDKAINTQIRDAAQKNNKETDK